MRRGIALDGDQREEVKKYEDIGALSGTLISCALCGKTLTIVMFDMLKSDNIGNSGAYEILYKKRHKCSRIYNKKKAKKR
jgi:hypothetical protein